MGDLRIAINPGGYDHAYPKDLAFYKGLDTTWLEAPKPESTAGIDANVASAGGTQEVNKGPQ